MEHKAQTKKAAFCCPYHGVLHGTVKYFSEKLGTRMLVDIPVMYCQECQKYYTPFNNLVALFKLQYKGQQVMAAKGRVEGFVPKVEIRVPHFVDMEEANRQNERLREERAAKYKQYIEGLRAVPYDSIVLTNKPYVINDNKCPQCYQALKSDHVKIIQRRKYLVVKLKTCNRCGKDYITPQEYDSICAKAHEKIRGHFHKPFIFPVNVRREEGENNKSLFIPTWAYDCIKYNYHHMPPLSDKFYNMTEEEYRWVEGYYRPEEFEVELRKQSFLGAAGYSTNESETKRRSILKECVAKYGKRKVIGQIKYNIDLRLKQKNGNIRYQRAINTWRGDLWYTENKL